MESPTFKHVSYPVKFDSGEWLEIDYGQITQEQSDMIKQFHRQVPMKYALKKLEV